ncbi:YitT family protein [Clostridium sp. DSM 17811]|nr:YitT family protein [Clostridium sp. DSM 17811]
MLYSLFFILYRFFIDCLLIVFSITSILIPNELIIGGLTGVSIILEKLIHIKYIIRGKKSKKDNKLLSFL